MQTVEVLKYARNLIAGGYANGHLATDAIGNPVRWDSSLAKCFCLRGAVYRAARMDAGPIVSEVFEAVARASNQDSSELATFSDHAGQEMVVMVFDRAIRAEAKAA